MTLEYKEIILKMFFSIPLSLPQYNPAVHN